ncbi:hypothetical protein C8J57DRAFT_714551 [Mycena rebaudengoi]|nr:hypothetical protein C8J57DRAFT_714551 [Mycena rebaudengoi]
MATKALEIPFEITSKIFIECLPSDGRVVPSQKSPPLLLAQVCPQWRSVALSTHDLWTSISLQFTLAGCYSGLARLFNESDAASAPRGDELSLLLDLWFARTASSPLSITVKCTSKQAQVPASVLDVLCRYVSRCWRMELHIPSIHLARISNVSGPFPFLHEVAICVTDRRHPLFMPFLNAPNLRQLRLLTNLTSTTRIGPALVCLTYLEIDYPITSADCLNILRDFPQLLHLSVIRVHSDLPMAQASTPLATLPMFPLQSLCLKPVTALLASISLPRLRRLTIDIWTAPAADNLLLFLSASSPEITYLDITFGEYINDSPLRLCATAGPSVETLKVCVRGSLEVDWPVDYELLHQAHIFPALHTLHMRQDYLYGWSYEPLLGILGCRVGTRLTALKLTLGMLFDPGNPHSPPDPDPAILGRFMVLSKEGINVRIETPTLTWSQPDPNPQIDDDPDNPFPPLDVYANNIN